MTIMLFTGQNVTLALYTSIQFIYLYKDKYASIFYNEDCNSHWPHVKANENINQPLSPAKSPVVCQSVSWPPLKWFHYCELHIDFSDG